MRWNRLGTWVLSAVVLCFGTAPGLAQELFVMTSNTDHAYIARHIGGDLVETYTPHAGYQEPELTWVDEIFPTWIARASNADVYIRYGLYADVWADTVIEASHNPRIQRGTLGYLDPTDDIEVLERPVGVVDRRMGDVHLFGNPHFLLDPNNAIPVAKAIALRFQALLPDHEATIQRNLDDFLSTLERKMAEWNRRAEPLRGRNIATYHRTWSYFAKHFGLNVVGVCEPKPGIEPTPADLQSLIRTMRTKHTPVLIKAPVYGDHWPEYVEENLDYDLEIETLAAHVGGDEGVETYFDLFDHLIDELLDAYDLEDDDEDD